MEPLKILMLGNSFTSANDLPALLSRQLQAEVTAHTRGGARLAEHLNPATGLGQRTQEALRSRRWDYVILQEMSSGPLSAPGRYRESVERLCRLIRASGAVPVLYATWAYLSPERLEKLGLSYEAMARGLSSSCRQAAEANEALVAEVGLRFLEAEDRESLYAADGAHPSKAGTRLAAETLAQVLRSHQAAP